MLEGQVDEISKLTVRHSLIVICANSSVKQLLHVVIMAVISSLLQMPSLVLDDSWASLDNVLSATVFMTMSINHGGL